MDLTDKHQDLQAQLAETTERLHEATAKLDQANARFSQTEIKLTDAETKLTDAETKLKTIETDLPTAKSDLDTVKKSLSSIHIDIIAVLSIFASIVLTFSGSMTVLGSALTGMQEVHALKATFFVLLCGFVLGNIIFLLMYLVGKLTSRNIYARCKTENCTCGEGGAPECRGLKRIRKRLPYIYWLNLILIVLMAVVVVVWYLDNHYHFIH
jgi:exonuclease VII small subunit